MTTETKPPTVVQPSGVQRIFSPQGAKIWGIFGLLVAVCLYTALSSDRFHLVGTAAGGFVCFDFALSFPDRLRSLVVANSIGGVQDAGHLELQRQLRPAPFEQMPTAFRELGPSYRAADPDGTRRWSELEKANRAPGTEPSRRPCGMS